MNHNNSQVYDESCPLCGATNECGVHSGDCWCFHTKVPQELRDRIPAELKGKVCICRNCVEKYNSALRN